MFVTRPTEYDSLIARHATRGQAEFFLASRGQSIDAVAQRHAEFRAALQAVLGQVPTTWRRTRVDRADLDRFLFEPDDIVVAVGQDGLVANLAKYLSGQPVIGVDPAPGRNAGVLVRHAPGDAGELLRLADASRATVEDRTMVAATLDDGQSLVALNEVFVGHRSHQSARYRLQCADAAEEQSSSGLIIATGTGATGWARSIHRERRCPLEPPAPTARGLAYYVREAWPGPSTGTELTAGLVEGEEELKVVSHMEQGGVVFGDGIESDSIELGWGTCVRIAIARTQLQLVTA